MKKLNIGEQSQYANWYIKCILRLHILKPLAEGHTHNTSFLRYSLAYFLLLVNPDVGTLATGLRTNLESLFFTQCFVSIGCVLSKLPPPSNSIFCVLPYPLTQEDLFFCDLRGFCPCLCYNIYRYHITVSMFTGSCASLTCAFLSGAVRYTSSFSCGHSTVGTGQRCSGDIPGLNEWSCL